MALAKTLLEQSLEAAFDAWEICLGQQWVVRPGSQLKPYLDNCGDGAMLALGALRPENRGQVQQVLRIACQNGIPVHPISRGCNWGYGTRCPTEPAVILDLSRMNKIIEINQDLAYAVIEPGVTQGQLAEALSSQGNQLFADATGSSPDASVLGNLLERGYGLSTYADHLQHCAGMEVVLADGSVIHTGFGKYPESRSRFLHRWGLGPSLDGLFSQSNLGVVTQIGVWLLPKPDYVGVFFCGFDSDEALQASIPALRELRLRGVVRSALHIANDLRAIASFQQYPFSEMLGQTPLSPEAAASLRKRWGVSPWNIVGGLWGTRGTVTAELREIRRSLKGRCRVKFVSKSTIDFFSQVPWLYRLLTGQDLAPKLSIFKLLLGQPNEGPLRGSFWRKHNPAPTQDRDPAKNRCGLRWVSPIVPLTSDAIGEFLALTRSILAAHQFEYNVAVTLLAERAACCTIGVLFDAEVPQETIRATACAEVLLAECWKRGFVPYRLGSDLAKAPAALSDPDNASINFVHRIRELVDPGGVISPGKYGIP